MAINQYNLKTTSNEFKVSGVYSTLFGRQDLNYTSPIKAKEIRKRHKTDKDINWYQIYHSRNLKHLKEVQEKQNKLKQQELKAKLQHDQLLQTIKLNANKKRKAIRNRSKSCSSLLHCLAFEIYWRL